MLRAEGIRFGYKKKPVLEGIDLHVDSGELCSVLGNNGAGKSTLLKCLLGVLCPGDGVILIDGDDSGSLNRRETARRMAYVAQQGDRTAGMTVFDAVLMGRRPHITWGVTDHDLDIAQDIIEALGLRDLALRYIDELSGGEAQKVMIARALAQEPGILLLDEPTSNLDMKNQIDVMRTVRQAVEERDIAAIIAIHDINLALRFSDKFLLLEGGSVLAYGGREVINAENIERTYGVEVSTESIDDRMLIVPR